MGDFHFSFLKDFQKGTDDLRIKLCAGTLDNDTFDVKRRHGLTVWAIAGHRIVDIRN